MNCLNLRDQSKVDACLLAQVLYALRTQERVIRCSLEVESKLKSQQCNLKHQIKPRIKFPQPLFQCATCENVFVVIGTYKSI